MAHVHMERGHVEADPPRGAVQHSARVQAAGEEQAAPIVRTQGEYLDSLQRTVHGHVSPNFSLHVRRLWR